MRHVFRFVCVVACVVGVAFLPSVSRADPWLGPGDVRLRHDLTILADAGILRTPVTTWPISWPDVARDVAAESATGGHPANVEQALVRISRAARLAAAQGFSGATLAVSGAERPDDLRGFADTPRGSGVLSGGGSWLGDHFAGAVRITAVTGSDDDQELRLDGSYVGFTLGNFMISAGAMDRWWGPGWDGSLILSSNARPMPAFTVERNYTDASRLPVLRWFGPWRASLALGRADGSGVAVPDVRILAARLNFRPRPWLEFGLSRTAQWCGRGRPCDGGTFRDLLIGRDNRSASLTVNDEPGNQLAGYDIRVRMPWRRASTAFYAQFIGEDEAAHLPSKFLGLLGAEVSDGAEWGSWRARVEYADTTCEFTRNEPQYNCAYRNGLYPQGYTYRGRIIGHSLDGDGRMLTGAFMVVRPTGTTLSLILRRIELNRDGAPDPAHTLSPAGAAAKTDVELQADTEWRSGRWQAGIGYNDYTKGAAADSGLRGFLRYSRGL